MPSFSHLPTWRLPEGVGRGTWDYVQADHIADDYDSYHAGNSLLEFDEAVLMRYFDRPGVVVDLGCGTGRLLMPFAERGFHAVAVDLSQAMLRVVGEKARHAGVPVDRVRANLVELDCLADGVADYSMCMFSTLGMIRGGEHRLIVLKHVRRILKSGGLFVLHVHNLWSNLNDPQGRWWVLANVVASWLGRAERGDKVFPYRGIANMYLHVFTRGELVRLIADAGLELVELIALDNHRRHALRHPWWFPSLRTNGWIAVCRRPA